MTHVIPNFINDEAVTTKNSLPKLNPFSNEVLNYLSNSEPLDFIKSIQPSQKAFVEWKSSTLNDRLHFLENITKKLNGRKHEFIRATATDLALPLHFVEAADFNVALRSLALLNSELRGQRPPQAYDAIQFSPVGPMGFVLSSNFPLRLFVENVLPAVLAGNSAVIKFSSTSASFISVLISVLGELNLAKGLIQVVSGNEASFKNFFVTHPGLKGLCVTGSNETLQAIQKQVSAHFPQQHKKIKFLGGSKNLAIVLKYVDQTTADQIFESFMLGQGQLHWNSSRLFVLEKNQKQWLDYLNDKMQGLRPSTSIEDSSLWTPIYKPQSVSHRKYEEINQQAKSDQAKLITAKISAELNTVNFLKPIFTQDMSNCSALQQDQVHSPLFILSTAKYPFDIPKYANVSYYGDTANVWCEPDAGQKVIAGLDVANVSLNKWSIYSASPTAGVKQSSFGITDHKIFGAFNSNAKILT